jgi:hypothetical protein
MELLIAILIWLGVIVPSGTYNIDQCNTAILQHSEQIGCVMQDTALKQAVWQATENQVGEVVVIGGN